jgi:hypothetical protein
MFVETTTNPRKKLALLTKTLCKKTLEMNFLAAKKVQTESDTATTGRCLSRTVRAPEGNATVLSSKILMLPIAHMLTLPLGLEQHGQMS